MLNGIAQRVLSEKHILIWQILFWILTLIILYLTLMPSIQTGLTFSHIDKLFHFLAFAAFTSCFALAFPRLGTIFVIMGGATMGIAIEIAQSFIPYRSFSYLDMLADFLGVIVGWVVVAYLRKLSN